jgi:hypothetical protein
MTADISDPRYECTCEEKDVLISGSIFRKGGE